MILTKDDQDSEIRIAVGQTIDVILQSQGGTGYQWVFDDATFDYFELIGRTSEPINADARGGGPVRQTWHLKSTKPGTAVVKLDYFRVWEGRATAVDHFQVKATIEAGGGKQ